MAKRKYRPFEYKNVTVVRIIDGDTVRFLVDLGFCARFEENFRLLGINAPEKYQDGGAEATEFVRWWLAEREGQLTLHVTKKDKYGRWLCDIRDDSGESLNNRLVLEQLAVEYMK